MNTLDQYLPAVKEAPGRLYFPGHAVIGVVLGVVLLVGAGMAAMRYPQAKAAEATQLLAEYGKRTVQTIDGANSALHRTQALLADQPEWMQKSTLEQIARIQVKLQKLPTVATPESAIADAGKRQAEYDQAQKTIAASPYRDLETKLVPLTAEGRELLEARKIEPPERFRYQQLMVGALGQLDTLRSALRLQAEAENLAHRIDVRVNGEDKAQPLGETAAAMAGAVAARDNDDDVDLTDPQAVKDRFRELLQRGNQARGADRDAIKARLEDLVAGAKQAQAAEQDRANTSPDPAPEHDSAADRARQAEARRAAEAAAKAERAEREAKRQAQAQEREAERVKREETRQEAEAEREAKRQAEAAKRAAEAKQRECTSSLIARLKCAKEGYNPVTGRKRGDGE